VLRRQIGELIIIHDLAVDREVDCRAHGSLNTTLCCAKAVCVEDNIGYAFSLT